MSFQIRHEKYIILVPLILAFLLLSGLQFVFLVRDMHLLFICTLVLQIAVIILFTLENFVRTEITVTDEAVTIRRLYYVRQFAVSEITDMQIERYTLHRRRSISEHRMRMKVLLADGRTIKLNDTAGVRSGLIGLLSGNTEALPDEDVALYQAYLYMQSKRP